MINYSYIDRNKCKYKGIVENIKKECVSEINGNKSIDIIERIYDKWISFEINKKENILLFSFETKTRELFSIF